MKGSASNWGDIFYRIAIASILALPLLLVGSKSSAQGSPDGLRMQVAPAFKGHFKYGEWLPIWIEVENDGPEVEAEIRVSVPGFPGAAVYTVQVNLPTISHKRLPLYVLANNFSRELDIQLFVDDELLLSENIEVTPLANVNYIAGLLIERRGALSFLNGMQLPGSLERPITLIDVKLSELPDRSEGLRSLDCLIINDIDTSQLSLEQSKAIEEWVLQGGQLFIGGGAGALKTISGLNKALLPMNANDTIELDSLSGLSEFVLQESYLPTSQNEVDFTIRVPGPFVVATGQLQTDRVRVTQDNIPIIVEKNWGAGKIHFITLDLSISPFDAWSGTTRFWENLIGTSAIYPEGVPTDISSRQQFVGQLPYALSNLPMLDLPSIKWLAILLGIYILIIGPVNYFFLKRMNRLHWAWVTIPAITLIFTVGAFSLGYALRGTDIFLNKITIVSLRPDGSAKADSYLGLFSPSRKAFEMQISGDGLISPLNSFSNPWESVQPGSGLNPGRETQFVQTEPGLIRGISTEQWSMQTFIVEGINYNFGKIGYDLLLEEGILTGFLKNSSTYNLRDTVIVVNNNIQTIGDFLSEQEIEVNMTLTDNTGFDFGPPLSFRLYEAQFRPNSPEQSREFEVRRSILDSYLTRVSPQISSSQPVSGLGTNSASTLFLLGWIDDAPPSVTVSNRSPGQQTTGLVFMPLTFRVPEEGFVSLPGGMIPGTLLKMPAEGGICGGPGTTFVYLFQDEATFEFSLPQELRDVKIDNLKLGIWSDSWVAPPGVSIFNWEEGSWLALEGISQGINQVPEFPGIVSSSGIIRVTLTATGNQRNCYFINLGLEGYQN